MREKMIFTIGMLLLLGILVSGFMQQFLLSIYGMEFRMMLAIFFADILAAAIQIMQIHNKF